MFQQKIFIKKKKKKKVWTENYIDSCLVNSKELDKIIRTFNLLKNIVEFVILLKPLSQLYSQALKSLYNAKAIGWLD